MRRSRAPHVKFRVLLGSIIIAPLLVALSQATPVDAQASGWLLAQLPARFSVGSAHGAPASQPISCVPGTTYCVAAVADGAAKRGGEGILVSADLFGWRGQSSLPSRLASVASIDCWTTSSCVAAGDSSSGAAVLATSDDGGLRWTLARSVASRAKSWTPDSLSCSAPGTCWLVGSSRSALGALAPVLAVSRDGGAKWTNASNLLPAPHDYSLAAISCASSARCVAVGGNGGGNAVVVATRDAGKSWTASASQTLAQLAPLSSVSCVSKRATCVAGGSLTSGTPVLALSHNNGSTWVGDTFKPGDGPISSVSCAATAHCWAAGSGALTLLGTADSGTIWQPYYFGTAGQISFPGSIACPTTRICVATTAGGLIYTDSDGGMGPSNGPSAVRLGKVPNGSVKAVVASATTAGASVDPTEASEVADELWTARALARHDRDPAALGLIEAGPALAVDQGQCDSVCPAPADYPLSSMQVSVPSQTGWPASFFAEATFSNGCTVATPPCSDVFVATQPQQGASWTIAFLASFSGAPLGLLNGANGYEVPPPEMSSAPGLLSDYAELLLSVKTTGAVPAGSMLESGGFTTGLVSTNYFSASAAAADGYSYTMTYTPQASPIYELSTIDGPIQCGAIDWNEVDTPLPGLRLAQTIDRGTWPAVVAPGTYRKVETQGIHMNCFLSGVAGAGTVMADWHGQVSSTGSR